MPNEPTPERTALAALIEDWEAYPAEIIADKVLEAGYRSPASLLRAWEIPDLMPRPRLPRGVSHAPEPLHEQLNRLDAEGDEMQRAPASPRPMSEAPRDGTAILLVTPEAEHGFTIAFWSDPTIGDTIPDDAGWYESEASSISVRYKPTGWFSLPVPEEGGHE